MCRTTVARHEGVHVQHVKSVCSAWLLQGIDVEPNVNFEMVASKLGGYSGDDITNICRWVACCVYSLCTVCHTIL
jgi:hypothetical protein